MPIAKVRIAPLEHWCEVFRGRHEQIVGMEVEIITHKMAFGIFAHGKDSPPVKWWPTTPKSAQAVHGRIGKPHNPNEVWICEHMLEMD